MLGSDGVSVVSALSLDSLSVVARRRLLANPSYYDLEGTDSDSLNAFLSVLVEDTLADLEVGSVTSARCYSRCAS